MREYHVLSAMVTEAPRNLGRRISRRLSMSVAKVPTFIQSKFRTDVDVADFSSSGGAGGGVANNNGQWWPQQLRRSRPVTLHIILPNGIERTVSGIFHTFVFLRCFLFFLGQIIIRNPKRMQYGMTRYHPSFFASETYARPLGGKMSTYFLLPVFLAHAKIQTAKKGKIDIAV